MNRKSFIHTFLSSIGLLITPEIVVEKINDRKVYLLSSYIAGYQYYSGKLFENEFSINDVLKLCLEENNIYDENAIAIYYKEVKIGYISRLENEIIANLIRSGKNIYAEIEKYAPDNEPWNRLMINVYMLET